MQHACNLVALPVLHAGALRSIATRGHCSSPSHPQHEPTPYLTRRVELSPVPRVCSSQERDLSAAAPGLPAGRPSRPKRSRQQREAELTRLALAPEPTEVRDRRERALAHSFFQRVKVSRAARWGWGAQRLRDVGRGAQRLSLRAV